MAGRYERVSANDDDDLLSNTPTRTQTNATPDSPPPSFRSRASSLARQRGERVDSDLADAFDDDDESDDDVDDRQRLVRNNSFPTPSATHSDQSLPGAISLDTSHAAQPVGGGAGASNSRTYGGGIQSDGVFSNLTAKPERTDGEKEEQPPTYEQAAADSAPPYWETTILAPGFGGSDEVYIDGLPVGSFFSFIWNGMISMSFQLVGFLLTYLLHSTHAAKNGSRAGLGITLIQYGFYMKSSPSGSGAGAMGSEEDGSGYAAPPDPNAHDFDPNAVTQGQDGKGGFSDIAGSEWVAYILMIVGWFILIRAVSDYVRARRHEQLVLQSPDRGLPIPIIAAGEASETVV